MSEYDDALRRESENATARHAAADQLLRAFMAVRTELEPSGWVLTQNPVPPQLGHFLVGFTMRRDGQDVSQCVFRVGPGRALEFERPGASNVTGTLDTMGEAEFRRHIEFWAGDVQAGLR